METEQQTLAQQVKNHSPIQFLINLLTNQRDLYSESLSTLVTPRNFINWSCKLTLFFRERWWGSAPRKVRGVGESPKQKVGRLWFGG